jgi:ADP-heptose:LPS heptosyltransferase
MRAQKRIKRILVFRTGHLGDAVIALPALWAIRDAFPDATIALLSNQVPNSSAIPAMSVLPKQGLIDEWIGYPAHKMERGSLATTAKLIFDLRKRRFDCVFYMMMRVRTAAQIRRDARFFKLAGIDRLFGFQFAKANCLPLDCGYPSPIMERDAEYLLNCVRSSGIVIAGDAVEKTDLILNDDEVAAADQWIECHVGGTNADRRMIGIAPGSKWTSKMWSVERYIQVAKDLVNDRGIFPVIVGGEEDREAGQQIVNACKVGAVAAGSLSVRETAALLSKCSMYLGNDSGPMHLAAAVGTPCVSMFAAIDWAGSWEPFGDGNINFRRNVECEGCRTPVCPNDNLCLQRISTEEVYDACVRILESADEP